jgi:lipopolysaccharide heptosyltransferase II
MKSLREIVETSPRMRGLAMHSLQTEEAPQPLGSALWDWQTVRSVLVVRLRSIGDTVLATPSLYALKRFLPHVQLDILLEDWVAPLLDGFEYVDNIITLERRSTLGRAAAARRIRSTQYDVVYNLHGGTTATLLTRASGAPHRVGYANYQYGGLHNHLAPSSSVLWGRDKTHSVEQQLALLGWTGVPVTDRPETRLAVTRQASESMSARLRSSGVGDRTTPLAVIHPAAAFNTKQWATENFAHVAEVLSSRGLEIVAITAPSETEIASRLQECTGVQIATFTDLSLPEVTALLARSQLFVGNDSGIAHMAAAAGIPSVVIFGSSNIAHWRPWAKAPAEVVAEELDCQPCHGYFCEKFAEPECIKRVSVERVLGSIDRVLREAH